MCFHSVIYNVCTMIQRGQQRSHATGFAPTHASVCVCIDMATSHDKSGETQRTNLARNNEKSSENPKRCARTLCSHTHAHRSTHLRVLLCASGRVFRRPGLTPKKTCTVIFLACPRPVAASAMVCPLQKRPHTLLTLLRRTGMLCAAGARAGSRDGLTQEGPPLPHACAHHSLLVPHHASLPIHAPLHSRSPPAWASLLLRRGHGRVPNVAQRASLSTPTRALERAFSADLSTHVQSQEFEHSRRDALGLPKAALTSVGKSTRRWSVLCVC